MEKAMQSPKSHIGGPLTDHDSGQTRLISTKTMPQWSRYFIGPAPTYRFQHLSPGFSKIGVVLCGCLIFLLSGYNVSLMGSVSSVPQYLTKVGLDDGSQHTQLLIGTLNAIYWVGVAIGALCIGWLSDKIGRRRALMTSLTLAVVIIPIFTSLQNFSWAITLRFLNGIAVGSVDSVGLNWTAETADHKHRGLSIGLELVCAPTAASIAYFMVYALSQRTDSDLAWRLPIAFQLVFVFMILSVVWLLPESPRWLVKVGLLDEARDVLSVLKGHGSAEQQDSSEAAVESDLRQIVQALENERADRASTTYWRMFTAKDTLNTRRRSWSAFFVQLSTQFMIGAGLVSGYGILLFETGGFSSDLAALLTGGAILTQGVFGIPGALLADKMGRRIALWGFALLGAVLLAAIGVCGYFVAKHADNVALAQPFGTAIITLVYVFSAEFGVSWLWVPFTYPSEIFPAQSRSRGSSIGIFGFACSSFLVNMVSPYLFAAVGYKSLFLIAGLSLLVAIVCFLFMPETTGKSLEDIDKLYDKAPVSV